MAITMPDLAAFKAVPLQHKVAMLVLALVGIGVGFYFYVEEPLQAKINSLKIDIAKLDTEINTNKIKIAKLEELKQLNAELQRQLSKNQEYLPPEEEAVTLLKQLSDLGTRIGLDLKLWRPGARAEDSSKLFVRLPVDVEMSGGYHTLALFFDRISKLPRIINVNKIKMGAGKKSGAVCRSRHRSRSRRSPLQPRPHPEGPSRQESETATTHHEKGHSICCRLGSHPAAGRKPCGRGPDDRANAGGHEPVDRRRSEAACPEAQGPASWQSRAGSGPAHCPCCTGQAWNACSYSRHTRTDSCSPCCSPRTQGSAQTGCVARDHDDRCAGRRSPPSRQC